jgi:signal transduction histidine kinase/putative methionine-R-sulfoxide reductase with GAF domain
MDEKAKAATEGGGVDRVAEAAARLEHALREKSERLSSLVRTTTAIVSADDLASVLHVIGFEVARFMAFDLIAVTGIERSRNIYRVLATSNRGSADEGSADAGWGHTHPLDGSAIDAVAAGREPVVCPELDEASPLHGLPEYDRLIEQKMAACVFVPMIGRDGVIGVMVLASREPQDFGGDNLRYLELIAEQLTSAIERERHLTQLRKRHGKLAIINEIARKAMAQFDMIDVLDSVASSIQHYFGYYDVGIFLVDDSAGDVVLMAQSGAYRELTTVGYRQKIGVGLVGTVAAAGETILANDVTKEPRRVVAFAGEAGMGAELCVPISVGDKVMGVINVECREKNAFDEEDIGALESFAGQIAQTIDNARLYEETRLLKDFNESIITNIPAALMVVDSEMRVQIVNQTFCRLRQKRRDDVIAHDISDVFSSRFLHEGGLLDAIRGAQDTGQAVDIPNIKQVMPPVLDRLFNLHVSSIGIGMQQSALVLLEDVTQSVEHAYQLSMLRQINEAVQTTLDLKRLLRLVLTCATSGHALGFNRGILLMVNKTTNSLDGRLAVGPSDPEDAERIWQRMDEESKSFKELLNEADDGRPDEEMPLYHIAAQMKFPLDSDELVVRAVRDKQVAQVSDAENDGRVGAEFRSIIGCNSFVVVPLVAKDESVGAIVVDNLYSGRPITPDQIELLTIYANHVGLAIENAEAYDALHKQIGKLQEAYRELRETQGKLVQSEKLAAVGEVAAHVAHEIRNPLVTIGGFARNIERQLDVEHPCTRSIKIVIEEVTRLEKILANVMDFSKPSAPWKRPTKINQVIRNTSVLLSEELKAYNVAVEEQLDPGLPLVMVDAEQLKQALLNILKNAAQSMSAGGGVTVQTRLEDGMVWIDVSDTGKGIPEDMLPNLFDPFFTTRPDGTGLGLAVTKKIIVDHGGDIDVRSKLGVGTTFTISLPADVPAASRRRQASLERSREREAGGTVKKEKRHEQDPAG